ncbi:uncharacterized protein LOC143299233 [Babylonia areolata]|uniref:uncharacterized protein LOC143299233 n=1 Tax=Babylonia areolata TaxID=304850 RepID=UPI003FD47478
MTTTSTFSGIQDESKTSSRVLKPPGGGSSNIFGPSDSSPSHKARPGACKPSEAGVFTSTSDSSMKSAAQRSARDGHYNPITGADYKDLAPNHHALHVKELPKPQKEQPPLPCSDEQYQAKGGKMQNVQTSTRITNPPGGKTHKLW